MTNSFIEKRRQELGLTGGGDSSPGTSGGSSSFIQNRKMELGLIPDTRVKLSEEQQLNDTPIQGPPSPIRAEPVILSEEQMANEFPTQEAPQPQTGNDWLNQNAFTRGLRDYVLEPTKQLVENLPNLFGLPKDQTNAAVNRFSSSLDAALTPKAPDLANGQYVDGPSAYDRAIQNQQQYDTGSEFLNNTLDTAGEFASYVAPLPGMNPILGDAYKATRTGLAGTKLGQWAENKVGNAATNAADKLNPLLNVSGINISNDLANNVAQHGLQGTLAGGLYGATQPFVSGTGQFSDVPESMAENAAMFGLGDAGFNLAGKAIGSGLSSLVDKYAGTKIGDALGSFFNRGMDNTSAAPQQDMLALPLGRGDVRQAAARERANLPYGEDPVAPYGESRTFELPAGNYIPPQRLRVESSPDPYINRAMERSKPIVTESMTPPYENPNELAKWIHEKMGVSDLSLNEVRQLPYEDMRQLAEEMRSRISVPQEAYKAASKEGFNLPKLLDGQAPNMAERLAQDAQKRTYGIYPNELPKIQRPQGFNISKTAQAAAPETKIGFKTESDQFLAHRRAQLAGTTQTPKPTIDPLQPKGFGQVKPTIMRQSEPNLDPNELKFAKTVRTSENTPQLLRTATTEPPMIGSRTSDIQNRQQAEKLIEQHGMEGLYSTLITKKSHLSAPESTAAQIMAKHYANLGGKENLAKAIGLVSKSAREGREMGQAIQALSQWNKMDETGALLLGERQLNRGVSDTAEWKSLTPEQAVPIQEAAQRLGMAQETKNLADEVLSIVTNKRAGEALTDAEKATIEQFQSQVKEINKKTKPFLAKSKGAAASETIERVAKTPPKERTRDQVVNYLDAKAELARQRLAKGDNVGLLPNLNNPVFDYAIIGASHLARGVRTFADYSEVMVRDFGKQVEPILKESYLKSVNIFRKENGLPSVDELDRVVNKAIKSHGLDEETARALKVMANEIGFMADKNLKLEATQDLQIALKDLGESTLGQKLSTLQTGAQLLNPVTFARNIIGGASQIILEKFNKMSAVPIDWAFSKLTGERTIKFLPNNQEKTLADFMMGTKSGWKGVSPTGTLSSYDIHPDVFGKKNPFRYITKSLGASLQGFDYAAYNSAKGDVLATYAEFLGKAQGLSKAQIKQTMPDLVKQLDQRIHELADQAGLYATFQDETLLSKGAVKIKRGFNAVTDKPMAALVEKGLVPKKLSTEGFGVGDIVVKYAKTPANLIMRAVDYSPLGIIRSLYELAPLVVNRSKFNQHEATRALSRMITGTLGLTGMGYILADAGILTGSASMDKDERSIQEQSGQGAYKVNLSALKRFLTSGINGEGWLNKESAKHQKGDTMMDYAWLQPAAISVAMGVNMNKGINAGGDISGWEVAGKMLLGGIGSVLENPMVQGVNSLVDAGMDLQKKQDPTKLFNIAKGVPASFVPTLLNQGRTATDNYQRETFDENLLVEMGNLMKNKVPGLSKDLPISYDSLGKPRERLQGGKEGTVEQYLTAFFSPAKMTEYEVSPEAKIVLDLMNQSGDKTLLPRINDRYIMVDDPTTRKEKRVNLTAEQYSRLQKKVGEEVARRIQKIAVPLSNPNGKIEGKVDAMKDILTKVGQMVKNDVRTDLGYRKRVIR